jgi:hypothetical protein
MTAVVWEKKESVFIPHKIPVPFSRVELDSEPARVAQRFWAMPAMYNGAKSHGNIGHERGATENIRCCYVGEVTRARESALRGHASGVDNTLRYALAVEIGKLLKQMEVFQQNRTAVTHCGRPRCVCHWRTTEGCREAGIKLVTRTILARVHPCLLFCQQQICTYAGSENANGWSHCC